MKSYAIWIVSIVAIVLSTTAFIRGEFNRQYTEIYTGYVLSFTKDSYKTVDKMYDFETRLDKIEDRLNRTGDIGSVGDFKGKK